MYEHRSYSYMHKPAHSEAVIHDAFFQSVDRIAKMDPVAFDPGAVHPKVMSISRILDINRKRQCVLKPLRSLKHGKRILAPVIVCSSGEKGSLSDQAGHLTHIGDGPVLC